MWNNFLAKIVKYLTPPTALFDVKWNMPTFASANISHLRSKYFTVKLFHLPEGQISLKKALAIASAFFWLPRHGRSWTSLCEVVKSCGLSFVAKAHHRQCRNTRIVAALRNQALRVWALRGSQAKEKPEAFASGFRLAPPAGLEPATTWLTVRCSANWAKEEY